MGSYLLSKLIIVGVLHLVKIVFVELPYEGSKVGMFKHSGENGLCKLIHVLRTKMNIQKKKKMAVTNLYNETVALRPPGYDRLESRIL